MFLFDNLVSNLAINQENIKNSSLHLNENNAPEISKLSETNNETNQIPAKCKWGTCLADALAQSSPIFWKKQRKLLHFIF